MLGSPPSSCTGGIDTEFVWSFNVFFRVWKVWGEMAFYIFRPWFGNLMMMVSRGQIMAAERKICFVETGERVFRLYINSNRDLVLGENGL